MMARFFFRGMDDTYKLQFWWRFKDDDLDNAYELLELEDDAGEKEIKACVDWDVRIWRVWVWLKLIDQEKWMNTHEIQLIKSADTCFFWFETYLFDPIWLVDKSWGHPRKVCQQKQFVKHVCCQHASD